jgi:hypothetical protein
MEGSVREIAVEIVRADGTRLPALINSVLRSDEPLTQLVAAVVRALHHTDHIDDVCLLGARLSGQIR